MEEKIKFLKIRNVKSPERTFGNSGVDFFVPEYSEEFVLALLKANAGQPLLVKDAVEVNESTEQKVVKVIIIPGNCAVKIPSGVKSLIETDYCLLLVNKSGVAAKKQLIVGSCLVDPSYSGEIHLQLINTSTEPRQIMFGEKLVQGLVIHHYPNEFKVVDGVGKPEVETEFYKELDLSIRGSGGFGSTGTK